MFDHGGTRRSRIWFWILAPFALPAAAVPLLLDMRSGLQLAVGATWSALCLLLVVASWDPRRFKWAARIVTGAVFVAYLAYLIHELVFTDKPIDPRVRRSQPSPWNAILGFTIVGVPCLWYSLFGRLPLRGGGGRVVRDPVLGEVRFAGEPGVWSAALAGGDVSLLMAGGDEPAPSLLPHAREIAGDLERLRRDVHAALAAGIAGEWAAHAAEISALEVDCVCLLWPARPRDGVIHFRPESEGRLWRCDYRDGRPGRLTFDG